MAEMHSIAEQTGDRHAVRLRAVLIDAAAGAFVAARAAIEVEHEHAAALVEALAGVFVLEGIAALIALEAHSSELALVLVTHKERAELYTEQFASKGLTATMEPEV